MKMKNNEENKDYEEYQELDKNDIIDELIELRLKFNYLLSNFRLSIIIAISLVLTNLISLILFWFRIIY